MTGASADPRGAAGRGARARAAASGSFVALGMCCALVAPAQATRTWTVSTRAGVTYPSHVQPQLGGDRFEASPTFELGVARRLSGTFSLLLAGTYITQRDASNGLHALDEWQTDPFGDYTRTTLLPLSVALRAQRTAPDPRGMIAGVEVGPALVWWREREHLELIRQPGGARFDANRTFDAWVPGLRAAGRILTPSVVGAVALELGVSWLRTAAVREPEPGFWSAESAEDGLSLMSFTVGLALRP